MDDLENTDSIKERLNSILKKGKISQENSLDENLNILLPSKKEMNKLNSEIENIKIEFQNASNNTPNKDKFGFFIKQANDMIINYEKQINYYKNKLLIFNPNDLKMNLTNWEENEKNENNNKNIHPNYFSIYPSDKDIFFDVINKIKKNAQEDPNEKKIEKSIDSIKQLYEKKLIHIYTENKNLENMIDKLTTGVINNLQEKIKYLGDTLNNELKEKNQLKEKIKGIDILVEKITQLKNSVDEKNSEITDLNKQQISNMSKIEQLNSKNKVLKDDLLLKNEIISGKEKIINTNEMEIIKLNSLINEKDNLINEQNNSLKEKNKEIKILYNDNIEWEEKYKIQKKEIENFKKWSLWDQNLIESFKKIDKLEEELKEKTNDLNKLNEEKSHFQKVNSELKSILEITKKDFEKSKEENDNLMLIKIKYQNDLPKIEGYDKLKDENIKYKKEIELFNEKYEKEINELKNKYENEIEKNKKDYNFEIDKLTKEKEIIEEKLKKDLENDYKEKISKIAADLTIKNETILEQKRILEKTINDNKQYLKEIEKKSELIKNLNILYDNLLKKSKETEQKLEKYETSKDNSALLINSMEISNIQNNKITEKNEDNNNLQNKTYSTIDKYSFTKEVLIDYLFCLYLYETGISIQNIINDIVNNLSSYLNFSFKDLSNKENSYNNHSNFPNNSMQYEFIEDIIFIAFDKIITKKIFLSGGIPYIKNKLDLSISKISFEDFDDDTIIEICYELINRNIITRLKNPKSLNQITSLFLSKYNKKFDFDIKLDDFINNDIIPLVQKRIQKYNNGVLKDMRILVELIIHNIKNGKLYIENKEVYSFENYYEIYNQYSNISNRSVKIEIKGNILKPEGIDNISHSLKYYTPKTIIFNSCFNKPEYILESTKSVNEENLDKIVKSKIKYTFENINFINSINRILSNVSLYQKNLEQLSFNSNKLNKYYFSEKILRVVKSIINLSYLDLSNNNIDDDDLKLIMEYLNDNNNLKTIILNNNNISSTGGFYIANTLSKNKTLNEIMISHNNLNDNGLNSFINILINTKSLISKLDLSFNNLKQENIITLANFLSINPNLKYLDISGNNIESKTANLFGIGLKKNKNLNIIKLNKCNLNDDSSPQIFNFMNQTNINKIELNDNQFGGMGAIIILNQLRSTLSIQEISLENCQLTSNSLSSIAQILKDWKNLKFINFKNNSFNEQEFKDFCNKVKNIDNIQIIFSKDKLSFNTNKIINNSKSIKLE